MISILISSFRRINLFRRALYSIWQNRPKEDFEVVIADEINDESELILAELHKYDSCFPWKFLKCSMEEFTRLTDISKKHNNPAWTNNCAFRYSKGDQLFLMGNEIIAYQDTFNKMLSEIPQTEHYLAFSTTVNLDEEILKHLDPLGHNLHPEWISGHAYKYVLASPNYPADVTNYLSLCSRSVWTTLNGYNEGFLQGLAKEDSDFVRRCRAIPGWKDINNMVRSTALSLHQDHGSRTPYAKQTCMSDEKWDELANLTKPLYNSWDGSCKNSQTWTIGEGVIEIVSNG